MTETPASCKPCCYQTLHYLPSWSAHSLTYRTYISSFISWQQLKPQQPKTWPSWLLLWKLHIFFRGMHNPKSPMLVKLFFLLTICTHIHTSQTCSLAILYFTLNFPAAALPPALSTTTPSDELMDQGTGSTQKELPGLNRHQCNPSLTCAHQMAGPGTSQNLIPWCCYLSV